MKLLNKKNTIILKSFSLLMLLLAWFIFEINDAFNMFMTITLTIVVAFTLSMDIYDYRKSKS